MARDCANTGFEPFGDADDEGKDGDSGTRRLLLMQGKSEKKQVQQVRRRRSGCASMDFVSSSEDGGGLKELPPPMATATSFDSLAVPPRHNSFHGCSVSPDLGGNSIRYRGRSFTQKRLTRQKKLRHLSGDELEKMLTERRCLNLNSQPVSPDSMEKTPSPLGGDGSGRCFPVPQPLPLPHRRFQFHRRQQSAGCSSGQSVGSPDVATSSSSRGKLRHSSDQEILSLSRGRLLSPPPSPDFITKARSSPGNSELPSVSPLPQPLPRPDSSLSRRPESPARTLGSDRLRSPEGSGKSSSSRNDQSEIISRPASRSPSNCQEINSLPRSSSTSCFVNLFPTRPATEPPLKSLSNRRKELPKDLNVCVSCKSSSGHSPQSSSSSCSSQPVSPQRSSSTPRNYLPCPDEVHFHSDFEVPEFRLADNIISPSSLVKRAQSSPDVSPLPSPTLQKSFANPRSPTKSPLPWHQTPEGSINQLNPCPLPLPPPSVVASPPQSYNPSPCRSPRRTVERMPTPLRRNQWQKGKLIGRGTYGSVYVGTNRETGALCAIKEVDIVPDDPKSAECIKQLEQEIKVLRHLKHPNIVQYLGSETVDDHFNIYLEYVYPGSISKYLQDRCGDITESIVRNFTRHILSGLAFLHGTKTIHRDIKGANLLVDASGTVKLADFGMAKHLAGISYQLSLKGTPHWMAPEVIQAVMQKDGSPDLAFAVDIWSLGCTVIEMFTGKPPWGELQGPQAMFKVLNKSPPIPEALSADGKDFLLSCFRRNPAERPTALALLEHPFVTGHSGDATVSSPQPSFPILMDKPQAPREPAARRFDILPTLQGTRTMIERLSINNQVISNMPVSNHPLSILRSHGREVPYM